MKLQALPRVAQPSPPPFPWREAMALGFGVLRLPSECFWALTPRELLSAVEGVSGITSTQNEMLARSTLESLMRAFPDEAKHE